MKTAPKPSNEEARLHALKGYKILDTMPEQAYDDITYVASVICKTPITLVSLVDDHRQWFKSKLGINVNETDRDVAFCSHAIIEPGHLLVVPDASKDERFHDNPLVTGYPNIRFYAGAVLCTEEGEGLGTLCVIDTKPRRLNTEQTEALQALTRQTMAQLELRKTLMDIKRYRKERNKKLIDEVHKIRDL